MPAPHWFFRFMYDRETRALQQRHDEPQHRELDEETVDCLANVVEPPGPVADLGCGPGPHALALARRGYEVVGVDGSPRMIETAQARAARDQSEATFQVHDLNASLPFADSSLAGVIAVLVIQHLQDPAAFIAEVKRCLRLGGHALVIAPSRQGAPPVSRSLYWRVRGALYERVPGVVSFFDATSLTRLVEDQGLSVVICADRGRSVALLASLRGT